MIKNPVGKPRRLSSQDDTYLSQCLKSVLRETVMLEDNRIVTKGQALANRLVDTGLYAISASDSNNAIRLIYERVEGKAAVKKEDSSKPIPRVVFTMRDEDLNSINNRLESALSEEEKQEGPKVLVETDEGDSYLL